MRKPARRSARRSRVCPRRRCRRRRRGECPRRRCPRPGACRARGRAPEPGASRERDGGPVEAEDRARKRGMVGGEGTADERLAGIDDQRGLPRAGGGQGILRGGGARSRTSSPPSPISTDRRRRPCRRDCGSSRSRGVRRPVRPARRREEGARTASTRCAVRARDDPAAPRHGLEKPGLDHPRPAAEGRDAAGGEQIPAPRPGAEPEGTRGAGARCRRRRSSHPPPPEHHDGGDEERERAGKRPRLRWTIVGAPRSGSSPARRSHPSRSSAPPSSGRGRPGPGLGGDGGERARIDALVAALAFRQIDRPHGDRVDANAERLGRAPPPSRAGPSRHSERRPTGAPRPSTSRRCRRASSRRGRAPPRSRWSGRRARHRSSPRPWPRPPRRRTGARRRRRVLAEDDQSRRSARAADDEGARQRLQDVHATALLAVHLEVGTLHGAGHVEREDDVAAGRRRRRRGGHRARAGERQDEQRPEEPGQSEPPRLGREHGLAVEKPAAIVSGTRSAPPASPAGVAKRMTRKGSGARERRWARRSRRRQGSACVRPSRRRRAVRARRRRLACAAAASSGAKSPVARDRRGRP